VRKKREEKNRTEKLFNKPKPKPKKTTAGN
jgi:hypothetical protein